MHKNINYSEIKSTNKASFDLHGDRVEKKYFRVGNAKRDYHLLKKIADSFLPAEIDEWIYRPLIVYGYTDDEALEMEYINGIVLRSFFAKTKDPVVYKKMGIWIGLLHKYSLENGDVLTFNDCTDSNFLVDANNKHIIGIDPGNYKKVKSNPAISFMIGFYTIHRGVLKYTINIKTYHKALRYYTLGYRSHFEHHLSINSGFKKLLRKNKATKAGYNSIKKVVLFIEAIYLYLLMVLYLKINNPETS